MSASTLFFIMVLFLAMRFFCHGGLGGCELSALPHAGAAQA